MTSLYERFNQKWEGNIDGCWIWKGAKLASGYGSINTGKHAQSVSAHRASYVLHNGAIPDGMHVLHKCDIRECVNPDHLFLGTNADNIADSVNKSRRKGVKRNRPSFGGKYSGYTVHPTTIERAKDLRRHGCSYGEIGKHLSMSSGAAWRAVQ